jgi:hypothetical protein
MNCRAHALYSVLFSIVLAFPALAQSEAVVTMDKVMTGEHLRTTGIESLTLIQRAALDRWLSEYTVKVIQLAQRAEKPATNSPVPSPVTYAGSGGGHWIKSKG